LVLHPSGLLPIAVGFFGLGTGYFVWGGQGLFGKPASSPNVDKTMGAWGIWMPGFMQFLTGIYLIAGLTVFPVFGGSVPNGAYMAALAFTAYGVHWFVLGRRRMEGWDGSPDGWMAIAFFFISLLGTLVFGQAGDTPVMILFVLLTIIYIFDFIKNLGGSAAAGKVVSLVQFVTAFWLMYLTYATVFNFALGGKWWL